MKKHFQAWYAEEVEKQLVGGTDIKDVKVDTRTSILKPKSANWLIGALESLSKKPEIVLNGLERLALLMHSKVIAIEHCRLDAQFFCYSHII